MRCDGPTDWQTGRRECWREEERRIERRTSRGIEVCKNYPDLSLLGEVSSSLLHYWGSIGNIPCRFCQEQIESQNIPRGIDSGKVEVQNNDAV